MKQTVSTCQVRVIDLEPGDVIEWSESKTSRVKVWREVKELHDHGNRVIINFTEGSGTDRFRRYDIVTAQEVLPK